VAPATRGEWCSLGRLVSPQLWAEVHTHSNFDDDPRTQGTQSSRQQLLFRLTDCEYIEAMVDNENSSATACNFCRKVGGGDTAVEGPCGHLFCWSCVVARGEATCTAPGCKKAISAETCREPSRTTRELILRHVRRAPCGTCGASVLVKDLQKHNHSECPEVPVTCPNNCGHPPAPRRLLQAHVLEDCPERIVPCPQNCSIQGIRAEAVVDHIVNHCSETPVPCPNGCDGTFSRGSLVVHAPACPLERVACTFAAGGCQEMVERQDKEEHVKADMSGHLHAAGSIACRHEAEIRALHSRVEQLEGALVGNGGPSPDMAMSCGAAMSKLKKTVTSATASFTVLNYLMVFLIALIFSGFPSFVPALFAVGVYRRHEKRVRNGTCLTEKQHKGAMVLMLGLGLAAILF
jgi:TRAF-type zinc finger